MADRRKRKRKETDVALEEEKPSKVEYVVAKYLRAKLPDKKTTLLGHKVDYFIASKAVDCLLASKWTEKGKGDAEPLFTSRESVVNFMETMLAHKFFHRAKKIFVSKESSSRRKRDNEDCAEGDEKKKKEEKESKKEKKEKKEKDEKEDGEKKREKKKVKLDMHMEQEFVDASEPYVWIYDPVPLRAWFIGFGLVFGAVAICLFPLWPRTVRNYVYYLSVALAICLFSIISLVVVRLIVFVLIWLLTFGRHRLWLLPNLTEDVGFFESFWPLYDYKYAGKSKPLEDGDGDDKERRDDEKKEDDEDKKAEESDTSENGSQPHSRQSTETNNGFEILDEETIESEEKKTK